MSTLQIGLVTGGGMKNLLTNYLISPDCSLHNLEGQSKLESKDCFLVQGNSFPSLLET